MIAIVDTFIYVQCTPQEWCAQHIHNGNVPPNIAFANKSIQVCKPVTASVKLKSALLHPMHKHIVAQ